MKLQECLQNFCSEEELTGADRYQCEKCNSLFDCTKSIRIKELPEVGMEKLSGFRLQRVLLAGNSLFDPFLTRLCSCRPVARFFVFI
jgi:ubiquitin C-terminal hydrolase